MSARRNVLLALFALAEASIIEPLLLLLPTPLRSVDTGAALAVTWLLLCAIAFSRRLLAERDAPLLAQRGVMGAWLVGLLLISIGVVNATQPVDPRSLSILFIQLTAVLVIWWRGLALGVVQFGPDAARLRLQIGLLAFVMLALATLFNPGYNLMIFVLPFLVGALFALPLCHIERVEQSSLGRPVTMDARWWRALGAGVGIPLVGSIMLTAIVSGDAIAAGLRLLVAIVLIPILAISLALAYVLSLLVALLSNGPRRDPLASLQGLNDLFGRLQTQPDATNSAVFSISPELRFAIGLLVVAVIVGVLIWLTGRARREAAIIRAQDADLLDLDEADALPNPANAGGLWRSLNLRRWLAALTIRRIYARMSHEAGKRGYARLLAQTPNDYLPRLDVAFADVPDELRMITSAYIAAHYGEAPDTDEAMARIRAAWERVRATPRPPRPEAPVEDGE
jgi:hypothetical protein